MTKLFSLFVLLFVKKSDADTQQAINELESYSDRELAELGISRIGIRDAVQFGRQSAA
ncbi:hypothetical protein [Marinomonas sp. THO17]|uniref:hypothetical protein n=1 Tax=Marinomonas sp. THO17 TaxID=3149048 RepID=UPI00336BC2DF